MPVSCDHNQAQRLLVFNCHEAWVYQLRVLGYPLDIVVGLPGRYQRTWDRHMRPVPPNSRLITLDEALRNPRPYACIITHNLTDLMDVRSRPEPRVLVLHVSLEAKHLEERATVDIRRFRERARTYLGLTRTHAVAVTESKARSWDVTQTVVHSGVDPQDYLPHTGELACGLRVCNFVLRRPQYTLWDFHQAALKGLPVRIVGHNPGLRGACPSNDWNHLRQLLSTHRFYVHTADPRLEDGYNMATLEAMAAGLPVLGNAHPTSPVRHGVSGFLSDDPRALRSYAERLLADPELAYRMGQQAKQTVMERFPIAAFRHGLLQAIKAAQRMRLDQERPTFESVGSNPSESHSHCLAAAP